ncbi:acetyl-CoA C-acetyltransferase [Enterococcus sp. AZ007]|uniref:acetyl-CoA C-acetyltransferase n=1 Tax=Enterococcus sp. AZ007 TaxID=2774839 RepID=UPI003F1F1A4F
MNNKVVVTSALRTPIGSMGGSLSNIDVSDLGAHVIKGVISQSKLLPTEIDEVYMGCVFQAGQGQNVARQASIKAGLPFQVPATTVNVLCGSGLHTINMAAKLIESGNANVIVAGGMENMSSSPYLLKKARFGYRLGVGELVDSMITDGLQDAFHHYHMGVTAENIVDQWNLSREELDRFSESSQKKACEAVKNGRLSSEILPVKIAARKNTYLFHEDESIREDTTLTTLGKLRAVFKKDGKVTAGNSSGISDGAAAVLLMNEKTANELGIPILAYWEAGELAGVDPSIMGIGPVASTKKVLDKIDLSIDDIELAELNEAFAAQSLAVIKDLGIKEEIVNVNGGAIALGHPLGASGSRIFVSLLHEMVRRDDKVGLASLCVGGGMGCSTIIRRK